MSSQCVYSDEEQRIIRQLTRIVLISAGVFIIEEDTESCPFCHDN